MRSFTLSILTVALLALPVAAQDHSSHGSPAAAAASADTAATQAFREANERMHTDMDIDYTNDVDIDFLLGMIPHHQAAIDMARIALEHSQDAEIRALAEDIISAQEAEIAQMRGWLTERGY